MIIKSTSRKTPSFSQLLNYLNKGRRENDNYSFRHNIYSHKPYYIVKEYGENYKNLKRKTNSNALYHEIISLKYQNNLTREEQREILKDLMQQYTNLRANYNMVYGVIHEQHKQIHCHLMISSNELSNNKNKRLSKAEFEEIKTNLLNHAKTNYPKLEHTTHPKRRSRAKARKIDNETQFKKRTGKKSDRELMKERLQSVFAKSKNPHEFASNLRDEKIQIYQRGKIFGFQNEITGRKYRLKTLELEQEFMKMDASFANLTKEASHNEKQKTEKELFKDKLKTILSNSKSSNEFQASLEKEGIYIYYKENSFGFVNQKTDWKYRLETLGLEAEFQAFMERVKKNDKNKSFADKAKSFGKRFLHEILNDTEHFITGKKPTMENEIWTQTNAGQRQKELPKRGLIR